MSKKLRGFVSTRLGVVVGGMKTKYSVDPGLQDTIVPIAAAQVSALAPRNTSAVYVSYSNFQPAMLPYNLRYLEENQDRPLRRVGGLTRLLPAEDLS